MTTDVEGSIDQIMRCADAGAQLVRLTVQGQVGALCPRMFGVCSQKHVHQTPVTGTPRRATVRPHLVRRRFGAPTLEGLPLEALTPRS